MYKRILTGCAVAALTIGAGAASAQDFKVKISGDAKFQAAFVSQDEAANSRSVDFRNRFRFVVNPEATGLDGALTYGAQVRVMSRLNDGNVNFEKNFVYLKGAFGQVYLGDQPTFNDDNYVSRPASWHTEDDFALGVAGASRQGEWVNGGTAKNGAAVTNQTRLEAWRDKTVVLGGQSTRIRYDSPFIYGLKFAFSYTPRGGSDAWDISRVEGAAVNNNNAEDAYEIGLFFDSNDKSIKDRFGSAEVKASLDYQAASNSSANREDHSVVQAGLSVGYAGITVGGGYINWGKSNLLTTDVEKNNRFSWNVGAQYKTGPWVFGLGYNASQKDTDDSYGTSGYGKKTAKMFSAGVGYTVAKGLDVFLDYNHVNAKNSRSGFSDNANVFVASTAISF